MADAVVMVLLGVVIFSVGLFLWVFSQLLEKEESFDEEATE